MGPDPRIFLKQTQRTLVCIFLQEYFNRGKWVNAVAIKFRQGDVATTFPPNLMVSAAST